MKIQIVSGSGNNQSFKSKIIKTKSIDNAFKYNELLLNEKRFSEVASFCRGLEAIFERGSKDKIYELKTEIDKKRAMFIGTWYNVSVSMNQTDGSGGHSSLMQTKSINETNKLKDSMVNEIIIDNGERFIGYQRDEFADKLLEEYAFNNIMDGNINNVLSDYGKELWNETKRTYNHFCKSDKYSCRFAEILKAQDELKITPKKDSEKINCINDRIKNEIRKIIQSDWEPVHYSYKRNTPQILNKTKKDFRQFYTGESRNTYESQKLLDVYKQATEINQPNSEIETQATLNIASYLKNWLNSLKISKNLIK